MAMAKPSFCFSDPFCVDFDVCFWIIVLIEDPTLVRIHDAMYLNIYPDPPAEK